jgi:hypothetical protein
MVFRVNEGNQGGACSEQIIQRLRRSLSTFSLRSTALQDMHDICIALVHRQPLIGALSFSLHIPLICVAMNVKSALTRRLRCTQNRPLAKALSLWKDNLKNKNKKRFRNALWPGTSTTPLRIPEPLPLVMKGAFGCTQYRF